MNKTIKTIFVAFALFIIHYSLFPAPVGAVCPVCTVAVASGLGLSRWLGIDDSISGIWAGGLIVSLSFWTTDWLRKTNFKFIKQFNNLTITTISAIFWTLLTYPPLWFAGIIGHPFNRILGIDKLIFGSAVGVVAFLLGVLADKKVRQTRGKQLFIYQKVVFPVSSLIIFSLLLYFFGGYLYKL